MSEMSEPQPINSVCLADLLKDPSLLKPPEAIAPRLGFVGRVVLLAAREKAGKSTLISAATAAVSSGKPFLGEPTRRGRVLLFWLEEHHGEVAQNIARFGGDPSHIYLYTRQAFTNPKEPLKEIAEEVASLDPSLVVVDSLSALAAGIVKDTWNAGEWTELLSPLVDLARQGPAFIFLHHARKSDGAYRDSSGIGAVVDMILEMKKVSSDPNARKIEALGRFPLEDFTVRLNEDEDAYDLLHVKGEDLKPFVMMHLLEHPKESKRGVREGVKGKNEGVDEALDELERLGIVENLGDRARAKYALNAKAVSYLEDTPTVSRCRSCILSWGTLRESTVPSCKTQECLKGHAQEPVHKRAPPSGTVVYFGEDLLNQTLEG